VMDIIDIYSGTDIYDIQDIIDIHGGTNIYDIHGMERSI
jgi:hypothetical protein